MRCFLTIVLFVFLSSCSKKDEEVFSDDFIITFDGAIFPCTGLKTIISADDITRLNIVLGNESDYTGTSVGLMNLKGDYKKDDRIKVRVTQYKETEARVCPAFTPFPTVLVLSEQLVK